MSPVRVPAKRANKYGAKAVHINGRRFDSRAEGRYYTQLLWREQLGEVRAIEFQPAWVLDVNGVHIGNYRADFRFEERQPDGTWRLVSVDVKGMDTRDSPLRRKLVLALWGVDVRVVRTATRRPAKSRAT